MVRILHVFSRLRRSWVEDVKGRRKRRDAKAKRCKEKHREGINPAPTLFLA